MQVQLLQKNPIINVYDKKDFPNTGLNKVAIIQAFICFIIVISCIGYFILSKMYKNKTTMDTSVCA